MNYFKKFSTFAVLAVMGILLQSCHKEENSNSQLMTVERQEISLPIEGNDFASALFSVDVPIDGPRVLVDSVMAFLNKKLYESCEGLLENVLYENERQFSFEEVKTDDARTLVENYVVKYKPVFEKYVSLRTALSLFLVSETESFVTYGFENCYCSAGCGSSIQFFTFDKNDGHQIHNLVENKEQFKKFCEQSELLDFFKNRPVDEHLFYDVSIGLMEDKLCLAYNMMENHYSQIEFKYDKVKSCLSKEVQKLLSETGKQGSNEWFKGRRIGTVDAKDGTVYLLERSPISPGGFNNFYYTNAQNTAELFAYVNHNGVFELTKAFCVDGNYVSSMVFKSPELIFPDFVKYRGCFAYDQEKKELYVPFESEKYNVKMHIYRFDGAHFIYEGKDAEPPFRK